MSAGLIKTTETTGSKTGTTQKGKEEEGKEKARGQGIAE